jgi:hypothetical protein
MTSRLTSLKLCSCLHPQEGSETDKRGENSDMIRQKYPKALRKSLHRRTQ